MTMVNVSAVEEILREYLDTAKDPFLNSMKGLPAGVFDDLIHDLVNSADCQVNGDSVSLIFKMKDFKRRVTGAINRELMDEVGLLIQYGASKSVISEVTGVHQSKIVAKRRIMSSNYPKQGRPRKLDKGEIQLITNIWNKSDGCRAVKLIKTHQYSEYPINDVWLVVRDIKPLKTLKESTHARQYY